MSKSEPLKKKLSFSNKPIQGYRLPAPDILYSKVLYYAEIFMMKNYWNVLAAILLARAVDAFAGIQSPCFHPIEELTVAQYQDARQKARECNTMALLDRPILIKNALIPAQCEDICEHLLQLAGKEIIPVQQRCGGKTFLHECTLMQALDLIMDSEPSDAWFAFVEGLLEDHSDKSDMEKLVHEPLTRAREELFRMDGAVQGSTNWLDYFPKSVRPTDCVVLAGQGATSTFHRDPLEWTGTSLCLEGRKIWRFVQPPSYRDDEMGAVQEVDEWLDAYSLPSIAWDDSTDDDSTAEKEKAPLSIGWQSDYSLYHHLNFDMVSAQDLAYMEPSKSDLLLDEWAKSASLLEPNLPSPNGNVGDGFYSTVQRQGDLLLIPAHWYHQTYAPEPSIAVASQRCGSSVDAKRVFRHILLLQGLGDTAPSELQQSEEDFVISDPEFMVKLLFDTLGLQSAANLRRE